MHLPVTSLLQKTHNTHLYSRNSGEIRRYATGSCLWARAMLCDFGRNSVVLPEHFHSLGQARHRRLYSPKVHRGHGLFHGLWGNVDQNQSHFTHISFSFPISSSAILHITQISAHHYSRPGLRSSGSHVSVGGGSVARFETRLSQT